MEIELKYIIKDDFVAEKVLEDGYLQSIKDSDSDQTIEMHAVYFDTKGRNLKAHEIAYRVREESGNFVATVKWGGTASLGLHIREEVNVPASPEEILRPTVELFKDSNAFDMLNEAVGEEVLNPVLEMRYERKQFRVDTGKSISVVSMDIGKIISPNGEAPISELEIEFYSGDEKDIVALGKSLCQKYNMESCNISKYERGLNI